jgi:hypothetical protein
VDDVFLHNLTFVERFSIIYQLIYSNFQGRVEEEKKALTEGKAPVCNNN